MSVLQQFTHNDHENIQPPVVIVYGRPGVGKTTFATSAPKPYMIDLEGGAKYINIDKAKPKDYDQLVQILDALINEKHDYKTIILDSLDWAEEFAIADLLKKTGATSHTDKNNAATSYGQGKPAVLNRMKLVRSKLTQLNEACKLSVIVTAHTKVVSHDDPADGSYEEQALKVQIMETGAAFVEWADAVLYMKKERIKSGSAPSGFIEGNRVLVTGNSVGTTSKNRLYLPEKVDATWDAFAGAVNTNR